MYISYAEPQPEHMVKEIAKREGRDPIEWLYEHFLTRDGRGAIYQCGIGYGVNTPYGANTLDGAWILARVFLADADLDLQPGLSLLGLLLCFTLMGR